MSHSISQGNELQFGFFFYVACLFILHVSYIHTYIHTCYTKIYFKNPSGEEDIAFDYWYYSVSILLKFRFQENNKSKAINFSESFMFT